MIDHHDLLAHAFGAVAQKAQADHMAQRRRIGDRGDIALVMHTGLRITDGKQPRTRTQYPVARYGLKAHQPLAVSLQQAGALGCGFADEILF